MTRALSLLDLKPLALDAKHIEMLMDLVRRVADEFDWRLLFVQSSPTDRSARGRRPAGVLERLALTDPLTDLPNRRAANIVASAVRQVRFPSSAAVQIAAITPASVGSSS